MTAAANTSRAVVSLAVLKTHWDRQHQDFVEAFVPLLAQLLKEDSAINLNDVSDVCARFTSRWGLRVPFHAMQTVMRRAKTRGFIRGAGGGSLAVVPGKVAQCKVGAVSDSQMKKLGDVCSSLAQFARDKYGRNLSPDEAESALLSFFKDHDLDVLFASGVDSVLPDVRRRHEHKYIVSKFAQECRTVAPQLFSFLVDLAAGHLVASAITYDRIEEYDKSLKSASIYLDTGVILDALGPDSDPRVHANLEFLAWLRAEGATLKAFTATFRETMAVLQVSRDLLDKTDVDISQMPAFARRLFLNGSVSSDVEIIIGQFNSRLQSLGILVQAAAQDQPTIQAPFDEESLYRKIIAVYTDRVTGFDEQEHEERIRRDVASIASVYRLRRIHTTLPQNPESVFITTNYGLALASRRYEQEHPTLQTGIPACVTDVFVGTLLWLRSPVRAEGFSESRLIADCYAAIMPDAKVLSTYLSEVEKLSELGGITGNEYFHLRSAPVLREVLMERSLGDQQSISSKTPQEILEDLKSEVRAQESVKLERERLDHDRTRVELDTETRRRMRYEARLISISGIIATVMTAIILGIPVIIAILDSFFGLLPFAQNLDNSTRVILLFVMGVLSLLNWILGFSIWDYGRRLRDRLRALLERALLPQE